MSHAGSAQLEPSPRRPLTRREAIIGGCAFASLFALGGTAWGLEDDEPSVLRPPGGQNEQRLAGSCISCFRCMTASPEHCIVPATLEDGLAVARTPKLDFSKGGCTMCEGLFACHEVCPVDAFEPFNEHADKIGEARIDESLCIAFENPFACVKCVEVCPYEAISLSGQGAPVVDSAACNGCGLCEWLCPSSSFRSYRGGKQRGICVIVQPAR